MKAFAIWVTGLPASGKSTLAAALTAEFQSAGIDIAVLESDVLRPILTPNPQYTEAERDIFYRQLTFIGELLTQHGVPVIFDATANRRAYREAARRAIPRFYEVYVECPLETCIARDPKGIYRKAREGTATAVPGLQATYEPPQSPDFTIHSDHENPTQAARRIATAIRTRNP